MRTLLREALRKNSIFKRTGKSHRERILFFDVFANKTTTTVSRRAMSGGGLWSHVEAAPKVYRVKFLLIFLGFFFPREREDFGKPPFYLFVSLSLSPSLSLFRAVLKFFNSDAFVRSFSLFASLFYDDDDDDDDDS
jgi:hypothetical protein